MAPRLDVVRGPPDVHRGRIFFFYLDNGTYGAPRVTAELIEAGQRVNHKRVARLTRRFGVRCL